MTAEQIEALRVAAEKAQGWEPPTAWAEDRNYCSDEIAGLKFNALASPSAIIELLAEQTRLRAEILALHRDLAGERLRADQGWTRYESANRDRNELRARIAVASSIPAIPGMKEAGDGRS
jgi:hypothetical protein